MLSTLCRMPLRREQHMWPSCSQGSCLVLVGSALHSITYVLSEAIMTRGAEQLPVQMNCLLQGVVATSAFFFWQLGYTLPRYAERIGAPMAAAGTTPARAALILSCIFGANLVHRWAAS